MKTVNSFICLVLLTFCGSANALVHLGFTNLYQQGYTVGQILTGDEFLSYGVLMSSPGVIEVGCNATCLYAHDGSSYKFRSQMRFDFVDATTGADSIVTSVELGNTNGITYNLYDADDNLLTSQLVDNNWLTYSNTAGISYFTADAELYNWGSMRWIQYDGMSTVPAPAPAAVALLGAGLLAMTVLRRRNKAQGLTA